MQYVPQQNQYPYPVQQPQGYPRQYPVQQYGQPPYLPPVISPEEQRKKTYQGLLRKNANSLGALLLIFFGAEMIFSVIIMLISTAAGNDNSGDLLLLENGLISALVFFFVGLIYCLIRRLRFSAIFPFDKIRGAFLVQLCVIGLCFSLMSNYVVDLLNNVFGLFGVENTGGNIDVGTQPNILLYFLIVAVLPAFAEEFAFRGIIMGVLRPYSEGLAIFISSATFALMHGNFVQLPFTFCCGLIFGFVVIKTNSLLPSIIIHFLNNGLSVLSDVLISYEILDEITVTMCYSIIIVILAVLSFIFLKLIINKDDGSFFTLKNGNTVLPYATKVKTTCTSVPMIIFAAIMISYCVLELFVV